MHECPLTAAGRARLSWGAEVKGRTHANMASSSGDPRPLVLIKSEDIKEEEEEESSDLVIASTVTNNNGSKASSEAAGMDDDDELIIKEEPIEEKEEEKEEPETYEVQAGKVITIKTEPREMTPDSELADVDVEGGAEEEDELGEKGEEEEEEEEDFDFLDDLNDVDYEAESSEGVGSDGHETSEGDLDSHDEDYEPAKTKAATQQRSEKRKAREGRKQLGSGSGKDKMEGGGREQEGEEEERRGSFEILGMTVQTIGDYSICPKCDKKIKSTFIIKHIKLHDEPEETYDCPEKCGLKVNRVNNLIRHLKVVHKSKTPYLCKCCLKCFSKPSTLRAHFEKVHKQRGRGAGRRRAVPAGDDDDDSKDPDRVYPCEFPGCGKEYKKRHHLKEHERKHTGDMKYKCDVCSKRFYIHAHMKRHLYSHTGIKPHECRWKCGAIFASYGGRMKHERINHYEENPLRSDCDICGRPFKNQQQLAKHRMTHLNPEERRDYRCSFCGIMFDAIKLRERHEERHRDGEVFACETCSRQFKNEKNLSHHIKTHHTAKAPEAEGGGDGSGPGATPDRAKAAQKKKDPPPKHHCHLCGPPKLFCLTSLRRHLARIHSTNFKCPREECGKCFKEKAQLDAHVEIHRLRECHLCGKKFQRKQNADIHLLGVHGMNKDDLIKLGRWNPKDDKDREGAECPEYMTRRKSNWKRKGGGEGGGEADKRKKPRDKPKDKAAPAEVNMAPVASLLLHQSQRPVMIDVQKTGVLTVEIEAVEQVKQEPLDIP